MLLKNPQDQKAISARRDLRKLYFVFFDCTVQTEAWSRIVNTAEIFMTSWQHILSNLMIDFLFLVIGGQMWIWLFHVVMKEEGNAWLWKQKGKKVRLFSLRDFTVTLYPLWVRGCVILHTDQSAIAPETLHKFFNIFISGFKGSFLIKKQQVV